MTYPRSYYELVGPYMDNNTKELVSQETISKCVEKSILRLPQFKKSLDDLRSRDYSKDGGARDDAILKSTISELHKLITEAPQFWSYELTIWAINTLANIGNILGPDRYTNNRLDSKSSISDQFSTLTGSEISVRPSEWSVTVRPWSFELNFE